MLDKNNRPKEFNNFLNYFYNSSSEVYKESGFVIELLINKFGKNKLLELIRSINKNTDEIEFKKIFKNVFNFELSYSNINSLV